MRQIHSLFFIAVLLIAIIAGTLVACKKSTSDSSTTAASISALTCSSVTFSTTAAASTAYTGTATVPYTGGNGATYSAGSAISSSGVTGLTATLQAGTLASGSGNLTYSISGTPSDSGTASFAISFGGKSCTMELTVSAASTSSDCSSKTGIDKVLCLIDNFEASLSSTQLSELQITYTLASAEKWSNFPDAIYGSRIGLKRSELSTSQRSSLDSLLKGISGGGTNEGFSELMQLLAADNYLSANGGGSDYGEANFHICILGTPSTSGTFEIYWGGHHTQLSNTYINGTLVGATPSFRGVEPCTYGTSSAFSYAVNSSSTTTSIIPMNQEATALSTMLTSLSSSQLSSAQLSGTYSDLICGPQKDWSFPTTASGLACSSLSSAQQALVLAAIKTYVDDVADSSSFISSYTNEISSTYISYSGTTGLTTKYDYVRIDGPHVWIEYSVGSSVVLSTPATHPHSVWRDKSYDYGGTKN